MHVSGFIKSAEILPPKDEASLTLFHSTGGRKRKGFVGGILINNLTTKFIKTYKSLALLPSPFCVCYSSFDYDESSFSWQEDTNDAYFYNFIVEFD